MCCPKKTKWSFFCMALMLLLFSSVTTTIFFQKLYQEEAQSVHCKSSDLRTNDQYDEISSRNDTSIPTWILDYANRHACALSYPKHTDKYLIYYCPEKRACGGVGDRLNAMIELFYIAMLTDRIFLIDYAFPFPLTDTLEENLVQWSEPLPYQYSLLPKPTITSFDHLSDELLEPSLLPKQERIISVRCNGFNDHRLWNSTAMKEYLAPYGINTVRTKTPNLLYKWGFDTLFRKNSALQRHIDLIMKPQLGLRVNDPYVAVHIRIGSGLTWKDPTRHHLSDLDAFLNCSKRMQDIMATDRDMHLHSRRTPIFVASDSQEAKDSMKTKDESVVIAQTSIFHIDRSSKTSESYHGNIAAWSEMFLLKEANCIVSSRSTFSEIAVEISERNSGGGRCWARFDQCSMKQIQNNLMQTNLTV